MSGTQVSSFPDQNILFNAASGLTTSQVQRNQLLNQETQQTLGSNEIEMMSRAAGTLLDKTQYPTIEARSAAYPVLLGALQRQGFAKNAPPTYPGDDQIAAVARMGTPSADLYKLQLGQQAAQGAITSLSPTGAPTAPAAGGAGGGGVAAPGPGGLPGQGGPIEPFATRLQGAEGNPGSVNAAGYSGQYQFGTSRLADLGMYKPAAGENLGANQWRGTLDIPGFPDVKTQADFLANPAAQRAALDVHVRNIDTAIAQTPGADQYDANGLRAVAHLGGPEGMRKFVASNGQYDPADANGTHLSDYYRRFSAPGSGGGTAVASTARPPLIRGDSLASSGGLGGSGAVGAQPGTVLSTVSGEARAGVYRGQPVVLSTGASNDPGDLASVEQQVQEARGGGASSVTVLGVGPGVEAKAPGTNAALQAIASRNGAQFVPLPTGAGMMSPDGVHPTAQGYATLKTAMAPPAAAPGSPATPAPYRTASNAPVPPPTPTAPGQATSTQPPAPGQPPAVAPTVAQVTPTAAPPVAPQMVTPGGQTLPAPPQAPALLSNGLTEPQWGLIQSQLKLAAPGGPAAIAKVLEQVPALANANRAALQQAWADAHPDLHFQETSSGAVAINPKDGHVVGTYSFAPNMQSRAVDGTGSWDGTKWVQGGPNDTPGKWVYAGSNPVQFLPAAGRGPQATFELQRDLHKQDTDRLPQYNEQNQQAAANQIRIQQMRELIDQVTTGAGGPERANWANIADTMGWHDLAKRLVGMGGAAAAQEFAKYGLATAGAQERGDLGARGSLGAITLYKSANPGLELQPDANKKMLTAQLVAAQANRDYTQGAMDYVNRNGDAFVRGGNYTPLSHFDAEWAGARNPQIYAAAMGAINGDPWQKWTKGLDMKSTDDVQRVIDIVRRADPTSTVMWNNGEPHAVGTSQ